MVATAAAHGRPSQAERSAAAALRAARRQRQLVARLATDGRLTAALCRVDQLEQELRAFRAASGASSESELSARLALAAPALRAHLAGSEPCGLDRARRNAGLHHFLSPAAAIWCMRGPELNSLQRRGRALPPILEHPDSADGLATTEFVGHGGPDDVDRSPLPLLPDFPVFEEEVPEPRRAVSRDAVVGPRDVHTEERPVPRPPGENGAVAAGILAARDTAPCQHFDIGDDSGAVPCAAAPGETPLQRAIMALVIPSRMVAPQSIGLPGETSLQRDIMAVLNPTRALQRPVSPMGNAAFCIEGSRNADHLVDHGSFCARYPSRM